ncbi:MAG: ATP phosphoribosyltransferase regulatory subunit, partial [Oscillospiraceae bacterium]
LGHIGFVAGLLDSLEVDGTVREKLEGFIAGKSRHELATAATLAGIGEADTARLLCICDLSGEFTATLEKAKKICTGKKMQNAIFELEQIYTAVSGENAENISLDLSLLNDTEFYDGILMAGYIKGLPRPVLAGGRYDGMMQKLGKNAGAIGFALYLDELARIVNDKKEYDVDVLILSEQCTNYAELLAQVNRLTNEGKTVRVEKNKNCEIRYKMCYNFNEKGLCEC